MSKARLICPFTNRPPFVHRYRLIQVYRFGPRLYAVLEEWDYG